MRIKMLVSKRLTRPGGGTLTFEAGSYYVTGGTDLSEEQATEWIMEGAAEDEAGVIVRPEPEPDPDFSVSAQAVDDPAFWVPSEPVDDPGIYGGDN